MKLFRYIALLVFLGSLAYLALSLVDLAPLTLVGKYIVGAVAVVALYFFAAATRRVRRRGY